MAEDISDLVATPTQDDNVQSLLRWQPKLEELPKQPGDRTDTVKMKGGDSGHTYEFPASMSLGDRLDLVREAEAKGINAQTDIQTEKTRNMPLPLMPELIQQVSDLAHVGADYLGLPQLLAAAHFLPDQPTHAEPMTPPAPSFGGAMTGEKSQPGTMGHLTYEQDVKPVLDPIAQWFKDNWPSSTGIRQNVSQVIPEVLPTDAPARVLHAANQGVTGASALATGGAQVLKEAGVDPDLADIFQFAAPVGTAGVSGAVEALSQRGVAKVAKELEALNMNAAEKAKALELKARARADNTTMTWAEAADQATNGRAKKLLALQRYAEESQGGAGVMDQAIGDRLSKVYDVTEQKISDVAPPMSEAARATVGQDVGKAAEAAQGDVNKAAAAQYQPKYQAAAGDVTQPNSVSSVVAKLNDLIANASTKEEARDLQAFQHDLILQQGKPGTPAQREWVPGTRPGTGQWKETAPATPATPETYKEDIGRLDNLTKTWQGYLDKADDPMNLQPIDKIARAKIGPLITELRDSMKAASPTFEGATQAAQQQITGPVELARTTQLGQLADTTRGGKIADTGQQAAILREGTSSLDTQKQAIQALQAKDPAAARNLLRLSLEKDLATSFKGIDAGGPRQTAIKDFANRTAGDPRSKAMLMQYAEQVGGKDAAQGLDNWLEVMSAMGRKFPAGSPTEAKGQLTREFSQGALSTAADVASLPLDVAAMATSGKTPDFVTNLLSKADLKTNTKSLAVGLLSDDSVQILRALGKMDVGSPNAQRLAGLLIDELVAGQEKATRAAQGAQAPFLEPSRP